MRQILLCLFILFACGVNAEQFKITGTVVDEVHVPIIFAKVEVKDADRRTITDVDGNFSIEVEKGAILRFSYYKYNSKEVEVLNDSSLFIELLPKDFKDIDSIVANKNCFPPPILSPDSFDFYLPESELKKLQLNDELFSGEFIRLKYDELFSGKFIQLNRQQIGRAKYLICEKINKDVNNPRISKMRLGQYVRQFLGVKHNGHKIVFINLVSSSLMPQFKDSISNSLITVDDGGNSFGYAIVDLTSGEVIMFHMNGD